MVAAKLILLPVIVKSVPLPSIFSPSLPKVNPTLAGILISPTAVRLISLPEVIVKSVPSPVMCSPSLSDKYIFLNNASPTAPPKTSLLFAFVASGINVKSDRSLSKPKKPIFAELLYHLYSIPLSILSTVVSSPKVITGSFIVLTVEFTSVLVPLTVKSPVTIKLSLIVTTDVV